MSRDGGQAHYRERRQPFGQWLIERHMRGDMVGDLAMAARHDRAFPTSGDPEVVRAHLHKQHAGNDVLMAIADAENEWSRL